MTNRCVCCGAIVPEGRQACPSCKKGVRKMAELKPCPFCGGKAILVEMTCSKKTFVKCKNHCCEQELIHRTKEEAIEAWNRRAEE